MGRRVGRGRACPRAHHEANALLGIVGHPVVEARASARAAAAAVGLRWALAGGSEGPRREEHGHVVAVGGEEVGQGRDSGA